MEFDINLVLVPATIVLLLVWLLDKFALKQHRAIKLAQVKALQAERQLTKSQQALQNELKAQGITSTADDFLVTENTPQTLKEAQQKYQIAKRDVAIAKAEQEGSRENFLVRWAYEFLPILLVIVVVRSFIIEPFNIPSSSMVPTLHTGDFIIVNKASYGLRLPITHTKILETGAPERGDVAVFRYPVEPSMYYIKRVIGLPGDTVAYQDGVLSINGEALPTQKISHDMEQSLVDKIFPQQIQGRAFSDEERADYGRKEENYAHYYQETLGVHQYKVRYLGDLNASAAGAFLQQHAPEVVTSQGTQWRIQVPEGQYFVMGDNRDSSQDSRYWGFVPEENLSGKATYIWMHKDAGFFKIPSFDRAGAID